MTKAGVGYGNQRDAYSMGRSAVISAVSASGIVRPDLILAFCSGHADLHRFYDGIRSVVGDTPPIVGGSSLGVITSDELSYHGYPAAVAAIESDSMKFTLATAGGIDRDERTSGGQMIDNLELSAADKILLLFYDSIRVPPGQQSPPVLNASAPLLDGVERRLTGRVPVVGAGLLGEYGFGPTMQFGGDRVDTKQVVGCMMSGSFSVYHTIMHGCIPLDGIYRKITRIRDDVIFEVDGMPVVPLIDQLFGNREWQNERPIVSNLTIGINHGDRYGVPIESNYVNRLITGVIPDGTGIGMFEKDLEQGQEFQFMVRDNRMMLQSVREHTPALVDRIRSEGKKPVFALYISCGGRTAEQSITDEEEGSIVQRVMNDQGIPFLGFYSGVEIAPMLGRSRGLDWTGVLLILAEDT